MWLIQKPRAVMSTGGAHDVISCPVLGGKKLQAVFRRRKFPFIHVWQPLWQSSRNISKATDALGNTHPSPSPKGKLQHSHRNPPVFVKCMLPQQECGRGALLSFVFPTLGSEVVCEHALNKQIPFSWHLYKCNDSY